MTSREQSLKLILWQLHEKLPKNSALTILRSLGIWGKLERWKSSISGCLMSWPQIKKNCFEVSSYSMQQQQIISWLDCDMRWKVDFTQQPAIPAQWLDQEEARKHFPKPNLHQKKIIVTICSLLPIWPTTAFWIPAKLFHLRSMLSKSMRCTENCNTYSWHWSPEGTQFFSHLVQPKLPESKELGYEILSYLPYSSIPPLTDWLPLL